VNDRNTFDLSYDRFLADSGPWGGVHRHAVDDRLWPGADPTKLYPDDRYPFKADLQTTIGVSLYQRPLFVIQLSTRTAASKSLTDSYGARPATLHLFGM
jgi:hypothetical protein